MTSPPVQDRLPGLDAEPSATPIEERLAAIQASWKQEAKDLTGLAAAVGPLTKPGLFSQLDKARATPLKVKEKVQGLDGFDGLGDRASTLLAEAEQELARRQEELRLRFAKDLKAACDAARLELLVVRREDPVELRIPPFAVLVDREKGSAELRFARHPIATAAAVPREILEAHRKAAEDMARGFSAPAFFDACLAAWNCARADAGDASSRASSGGERIEIQAFLPHLALQLQPRAFRIEPSAKNFRPYSRARFAFDLMQLRQAGMLSRNGMRLNLGVASGATASKKNRSLFVEDELGRGEYKLTVYFTRMES